MIDRVYFYKMTSDTGFAPNPFFGYCTLACCMKQIRANIGKKYGYGELKDKEVWVIGIAGNSLKKNRLVYCMNVAGVLSFAQYSQDERFVLKHPDKTSKDYIVCHGDNILKDGERIDNEHSLELNKADMSVDFVLYSDRFFYYGKTAPDISDVINKLSLHKVRSMEFHTGRTENLGGFHSTITRSPSGF